MANDVSTAPLDRIVRGLPPCPSCGGCLHVEWRLVATGPAMVAGVMTKLSAVEAPHLVCDGCGFVECGKLTPNA